MSDKERSLLVEYAYRMREDARDYYDAACYNERSRLHMDRVLAQQQFAAADAYKKSYDRLYDNIIKPFGYERELTEMIGS